MKFKILVVDDEKNIRQGLGKAMEIEGYDVVLAENGEDGLRQASQKEVDLVIADLRMPVMGGQELLRRLSAEYPTLPVIILTGHGTIENAVTAMRNGAFDFLTKPVNLDRLALLVKRALANRDLMLKHRALQSEVDRLKLSSGGGRVIGKSAVIKRVLEIVRQVADTKASVLITGESGVGKEMIVDLLHNYSSRKEGPFIKVHCAALSESLLESELFGHEKGAFTGATNTRKGRFELADQGTLFLDEIGEISQAVQIKILRVLQEKQFERVGSEKTRRVDVRIVAATNRDLSKEVAEGGFREDLFYRLNVVNIHIPPLRDRQEDIPLLIAVFLEEFNRENQKKITDIDGRTREMLYNYPWPGNIRELRNCVESAVVLCKSETISPEDLPPTITGGAGASRLKIPLGLSLAEAEKKYILGMLSALRGNKTRAAQTLGISRKTLHRKLDVYKQNDK